MNTSLIRFAAVAGFAAALTTLGMAQSTNVFNSTGNVGIGTTNPLSPLHLYSTGGYQPQLTLENVADSGAPYVIFKKSTSNNGDVGASSDLGTVLFEGYYNGGYRQSSYMMAQTDAPPSGDNVYSSIIFVSHRPSGSAGENMRITSAGNVGIGNTNPDAPLTFATTTGEKIHLYSSSASQYGLAVYSSELRIFSGGAGATTFGLQGGDGNFTEHMRIAGNGNVGIGVTDPVYKLEVNGTVRAKEVIVEANNWPDYVFAKGAPQPSAADWERSIRTVGHLPGLPSKAEAEKDGVSVGQMQKALLKKVEQLSLLVIRQQKENEKAFSAINDLRKQNQRLEKEVRALRSDFDGRVTE